MVLPSEHLVIQGDDLLVPVRSTEDIVVPRLGSEKHGEKHGMSAARRYCPMYQPIPYRSRKPVIIVSEFA